MKFAACLNERLIFLRINRAEIQYDTSWLNQLDRKWWGLLRPCLDLEMVKHRSSYSFFFPGAFFFLRNANYSIDMDLKGPHLIDEKIMRYMEESVTQIKKNENDVRHLFFSKTSGSIRCENASLMIFVALSPVFHYQNHNWKNCLITI